MSGDYTRFTFRNGKDYSSVLKQQGRVDLDADFNELIEMVDRRWRSETIDIIGHAVVPISTHDAFLVTPTAIGSFDIGIGRMYVDGIQVECHGRPAEQYQADLGELRGTSPVPYSDQPYLPAPLPPPLAAAAGATDLVYLDVWQREVTAIEDPSIREIALGGPDTATRVQAVWQVRVLQNVGAHGCGDAIPLWDQTVAPSAGRLTTSAVAPPASDDPCIIAPGGGFRGLENRLYRVEIHSTGGVGGGAPAKFKWSRNNASVASAVTAIPAATSVEVQQIGRDRVLRFEVGNWIEITDDFRELQGLAGHMAKITGMDEANRLLTFAPPIPAAIPFDPSNATRHTRVKRWDQTQNVDANGLVDAAAGPIDLEDGVRVGFGLDPVGGNFKIGDYWVFAARTADGSVETLTNAPPRGILHHYSRLGLINWGATLPAATFTDCRVFWPHCDCEGHCTVTVGDGVDSHGQFTDIQEAIDALGNRGGVVCIGRGFYLVRRGLRVDDTKRNVIIRGMGPATRIVFMADGGDAFLEMRGTEHVRLEDVYVVAVNAAAVVRITESQYCRVTRCVLANLPREGGDSPSAPRAIELVENCTGCDIFDSALIGSKAVTATSGRVSELRVRDNQTLSTLAAIVIREGRNVEIAHNQFRALPPRAVPPTAELTRESFDAFQTAISAVFRTAATSSAFQAAGLLIYSGNGVVIEHNLIAGQVALLGFLMINTRIEGNDILAVVGILNIYGISVKIEDNLVLGVVGGLIHAGILVDLDCTANEWVGSHGVIWMSPRELIRAFAPILAGALGALGLAGGGVIKTTSTTGTVLTSAFLPFGMVVLAKVHRNAFMSFVRGIYKTDEVISADVSIIDNSISLSTTAGIELGGGGRLAEVFFRALGSVVTLRHLIQSNSIAVRGRGILTSTPLTAIDQNTVNCPSECIELDAPFCRVCNNMLQGTGGEAQGRTGLLVLFRSASNALIAGNQLLSAPGFSMLVEQDVFDLTVEDNIIRGAARAGFGTRHDAIMIRRLRMLRNQVEGCRGASEAGTLQIGGAITIGSAEDAQLVGNRVMGNSPPASNGGLRWFALYVEDAYGIDVSENMVAENVEVEGVRGFYGAIGLQGVTGTIRVQNNIARDNGGLALFIGETRHAVDGVQHALVENNHLSDGPPSMLPTVVVEMIESLVFSGNQCRRARPGVMPTVLLQSVRATVCGNYVETPSLFAMAVLGVELVVNANMVRGTGRLSVAALGFPARAVVTSNLTSFITATSTGVLVRGLNSPAP